MQFSEKAKRHIAQLIICLIMSYLYIFWGNIVFKYNDDLMLNMTASGAFGSGSEHLIYMNIVYGYILKLLFFLFKSINWYLWILLAGNVAGIYFISVVIGDKFKASAAILTTVITNLIIGIEFLEELQYTKTALLLCAAGFMLILRYLLDRRKAELVSAVIMLFFGTIMRFNCMLYVFPFFLIAMGYIFFCKRISLKVACITIASVILCATAIFAADKAVYNSDSDWKEYMEYNKLRQDIIDHYELDYDEYADEYAAMGVTEADIYMWSHWYFYDTEMFNIEKLRAVRDFLYSTKPASIRLDMQVIFDTIQIIVNRLSTYLLPVIWLIITAGVLIFGNRGQGILALMLSASVCMGYWYMVCISRIAWRVEIGSWIGAICMLLVCIGNNAEYGRKENAALEYFLAGLLFILCIASNFYTYKRNGYSSLVSNASNHEFYEEIGRRQDSFYFGDLGMTCVLFSNNIMDINGSYSGYLKNFGQLGSWEANSPTSRQAALSYGIDNPMRELFENENVFLAGEEEHAKIIEKYLQMQYDERITCEFNEDINGISIWKYKIAD